jgi:hypothetical protein
MRGLGPVLLVALAGCAHGPRPPVTLGDRGTFVCNPEYARLSLVATDSGPRSCDGDDCRFVAHLRLESCLAGPVVLIALVDDTRGGASREIPLGPATLAARTEVEIEVALRGAGKHGVAFHAKDAGGKPQYSDVAEVYAGEPPVRITTREACDACRGDWGPHGLAMRIGCICRTSDAGRECLDDLDCEATCVPTALREVPGRGKIRVGKCAAEEVTFGCQDHIPAGTAAEGPQPRLTSFAGATTCID